MIYLYLSTNDTPQSIAIRYYTNSPYSHVGFYDSETNTFLSAHFRGGVLQRKVDGVGDLQEKFNKIAFFTAPYIDAAYAYALTQVGKPYDLVDILAFVADRDWHQEDKFICSELVAFAFEKINAPLLNPSIKVTKLTPRDILLSLALTPADNPLPSVATPNS